MGRSYFVSKSNAIKNSASAGPYNTEEGTYTYAASQSRLSNESVKFIIWTGIHAFAKNYDYTYLEWDDLGRPVSGLNATAIPIIVKYDQTNRKRLVTTAGVAELSTSYDRYNNEIYQPAAGFTEICQ